MKLNRYLWSSLSLIAAMTLSVGCDDDNVTDDPTVEPITVSLSDVGQPTATSLQFTITPEGDATECYYFVQEAALENFPTKAEEVAERGVKLQEVKVQQVVVNDLQPDTKYKVTAALISPAQKVLAQPIEMTTAKDDTPSTQMKVTISDIKTTTSTISYVVTCVNASEGYWDCYEVTPTFKDDVQPHDVFGKGHKIESVLQPYTVVVENLKDDTEYSIYAAIQAPAGYDRILTKERVRTQKLDAPDELPEQTFDKGEMTVYNGKNYLIKSENDQYAITLDFFSSSESAYLPSIPEHEYSFNKGAYIGDWYISGTTKVVDKATNTSLEMEKGSFSVTMPTPSNYVFTGKFITTDNKAFNFKFTGELPFDIDSNSSQTTANLKTIDGKQHLILDVEYSVLDMTLPEKLENNHTYTFTEPVAWDVKRQNRRFTLPTAQLTVASEDGEFFSLKFAGTTSEGLKVYSDVERIRVNREDTPEPPVEDEDIAFSTVTATVVDTYWMTTYQVEMDNKEWNFVFEIGANCGPGEVPFGTYVYSSVGEGAPAMDTLGENYSIVNRKDSMLGFHDLDKGEVVITKNDDGTHSVVVNIKRDNGHTFKGHFTGKIECFYYGDGGGGGWE